LQRRFVCLFYARNHESIIVNGYFGIGRLDNLAEIIGRNNGTVGYNIKNFNFVTVVFRDIGNQFF